MACQVRVTAGMEASAQNYLGSPKFDLLRVADWMFPAGLNHHEFMAGVPVAEDLMKAMARRIAGLGTLPDAAAPVKEASREVVDVLVVGGGIAGRAVADALPGAVVVDAAAGAIAIGVYGATNREVLVITPERTVLYAPRALVLAPGAHEGLPVFEDNDLPGIVSLRGAMALAARDVDVGHAPLVVEVPGGTGLGRAFATARGYRHVQGTIEGAAGGSSVERVTIGGAKHETDALIIDGPRSPSFELAVQAGAGVEPAAFGFRVRVDTEGRAASGLWVCGEATGIAFTTDVAAAETRASLVAQARRVAASLG
jgi:sarcosine oxidase subunit alpha